MLGYLTWTHVSAGELSLADVERTLRGIALPTKPLPIDVYRRITGTDSTRAYSLEDGRTELTMSCAVVDDPSPKMLCRHVVMKVVVNGVVQEHTRVGDAVFYRPPRSGEWTKARLRVSTLPVAAQYESTVIAYAEALRQAYAAGCAGVLDGQGIRRIVRNHLTSHGALYLEGGPYFTVDNDGLEPLRNLFDLLGKDTWMHSVPLVDTAENRALVAHGVERAIDRGVDVHPAITAITTQEVCHARSEDRHDPCP